MIKYFLLLFFFGVLVAFGQKSPKGMLVKFNASVQESDYNHILTHVLAELPSTNISPLKGIDMVLVSIEGNMSVDSIDVYRNALKKNEKILFTSVIYGTERGSIAADLNKAYIKTKSKLSYDQMSIHLRPYKVVNYYPHAFLENVWELELDKCSAGPRIIQEELSDIPDFEFISVNTLHSIQATSDDPYYEYQWALKNEGTAIHFDGTEDADMDVEEAWIITAGSPLIKVAVLDSGIDTNHVDLRANLLPGFDATGADQKGYPNTTYSNDGHGTCSAGIIGAIADNEIGIAGIANQVKIIPVRIFFYAEFGGDVIPVTTTEFGVNGINWAVETGGADILSNSWGIRNEELGILSIDTALGNATIKNHALNGRGGKGVPMLFSSGNDGDAYSIWPSSHPLTIAVGASSMCDELKTFSDCSPESWRSNYNENLDVVAPGVKVLSTDMTGELGYNNFIDDDYAWFNGTSAACPNAAGVMALILSVDPDLTAFEARAILSVTADKTGGYAYDEAKDFGMWSERMGYGRVNAFQAVQYAQSSVGLKDNSVKTYNDYITTINNQTLLVLDPIAPANISVYNVMGQLIKDLGISSTQTINISDQVTSASIYLIRIERYDVVETMKVYVW
ncbi:S8 family peptidase [Crocinitomix catalasitica]|uniref:S8 family peptidase n=1 Tax=Crocinitomix catalasitica TaxID=184607 RepID=UPI000482388E|nr:S8 family peptidase [Crocinitomix catalasitica]